MTTNKRAAEIAIEATDEVAMKRQQIDNINQIHIKIIRCCDIQSRRRGMRTYIIKFINLRFVNLTSETLSLRGNVEIKHQS